MDVVDTDDSVLVVVVGGIPPVLVLVVAVAVAVVASLVVTPLVVPALVDLLLVVVLERLFRTPAKSSISRLQSGQFRFNLNHSSTQSL